MKIIRIIPLTQNKVIIEKWESKMYTFTMNTVSILWLEETWGDDDIDDNYENNNNNTTNNNNNNMYFNRESSVRIPAQFKQIVYYSVYNFVSSCVAHNQNNTRDIWRLILCKLFCLFLSKLTNLLAGLNRTAHVRFGSSRTLVN
jgi:hypothetical protein